ncbi:hypothetical protein M8C21_005658 [Ambrosia artemisiifolia]|uniref:Uncharacterized protein n=1 Tax=Ambrosia artemisiifolia TaxID=4212 RepID=A0AAD5CIR9_AMBAR|nr:hypothetical protein M8C21_005658 [Ambrosia artemisiifolia]
MATRRHSTATGTTSYYFLLLHTSSSSCSVLFSTKLHLKTDEALRYNTVFVYNVHRLNTIPTKLIEDQKTGTSSLQKKVKVFMQENYPANRISEKNSSSLKIHWNGAISSTILQSSFV